MVAADGRAEALRLSILVLIGWVLPAVVHLIPSSVPLGPILMPLMIPIALAAFVLPLRSALAASAIIPALSLSTTGMPPLPIAVALAVEGMALVASVQAMLSRGASWWVAFLAGVLVCRVAGAAILATFLGQPLATAASTMVQGLVGLALAGMALPVLFRAFGRKDGS